MYCFDGYISEDIVIFFYFGLFFFYYEWFKEIDIYESEWRFVCGDMVCG